MASRQTGRQTGRQAGKAGTSGRCVFQPSHCLFPGCGEGEAGGQFFWPGGSLKINGRIHWGLSFLSLRLNEVVCA